MTALQVMEWGFAAIVAATAVFMCGVVCLCAFAVLRDVWKDLK
jgi:hypothetical protein